MVSAFRRNTPSYLQAELERAICNSIDDEKIVQIVQTASDEDIAILNSVQWTPLVAFTHRLGKHTTSNGNSPESECVLVRMIRECHARGMDVNSAARFGVHHHRPLIVAAYFGFPAAVRLLLELGAIPGLEDGEGRNVLFAAFQNPVRSGPAHWLRECDRCTARVLLDCGAVTKDLGVWRRSRKLSVCYINEHSMFGSTMFRALFDRNADVVEFLIDAGAVLTDRDYLRLRSQGLSRSRLLSMVAKVVAISRRMEWENISDDSKLSQLMRIVNSWSPETDWSFPPTWKVGVALCQNCGLPSDVFQSHVVPFMDRDWFFAR
ncbi:hypothetical protein ACHAWF_005427 [Thalassiosira exigua]